MVRISQRIWDYWREIEEFGEPSIVLLFSSRLSPDKAMDALAQAAGDAMREREAKAAAAGPGEDEFSTGCWSLAPVPDGVAMRIDEEPHDFAGLVRRIADGLEAIGVDGAFDLFQPEQVLQVPERVDLLECRLRVRGGRYQLPNGKYRWRADPDALLSAVDAGIGWCVANEPGLPLSLAVGLITPATLPAEDDIRAYVRKGLELTAHLGVVRLTSAASDRFRTVSVDASSGRVTLIEGGATIEDRGWEPSLRSLRHAMKAASSSVVYGFVKRGSRTDGAELGVSLYLDWVPVPHHNPLSNLGEPFEDELAPDAFGVQLLGPGYDARLSVGPNWTRTPVASGAVLLEHADAGAWFGRLFGPFGGYRTVPTDPSEIPDVVARAREDLDRILFRDDVALSR
jgi:hypothetical protein